MTGMRVNQKGLPMKAFRMSLAFSVYLLVLLPGAVSSAQDSAAGDAPRPGIYLEAELERGEVLSRLVVSIHNTTNAAFSFETGSRGGGGSLDDGFRFKPDPKARPNLRGRWTTGTAPTVIPEFVFRYGEADYVYLQTPAFGGPPRRSMERERFTVDADSRLQYASFAVPTRTVSGDFVQATLKVGDRTLKTKTITVKSAALPDDADE